GAGFGGFAFLAAAAGNAMSAHTISPRAKVFIGGIVPCGWDRQGGPEAKVYWTECWRRVDGGGSTAAVRRRRVGQRPAAPQPVRRRARRRTFPTRRPSAPRW